MRRSSTTRTAVARCLALDMFAMAAHPPGLNSTETHRNNDLAAGVLHCLQVRPSALRFRSFSESHVISQSSSGKSWMDIVEWREGGGQRDDKGASMSAGPTQI